MALALNDIHLQMTLTFEQALVEYKHVFEFYELYNMPWSGTSKWDHWCMKYYMNY